MYSKDSECRIKAQATTEQEAVYNIHRWKWQKGPLWIQADFIPLVSITRGITTKQQGVPVNTQ